MSAAELVYRVGTGAYHLGIAAAARLGNERAARWVAGRRLDVRDQVQALHAAGRPILWLHAASLGEFEQGRPVLEVLRMVRPDWAVVLTFFSPSGYERCQATELAEVVTYLPADTPRRAAAWIELLRPRLAVFVKYEFWYYHLRSLRSAGVPTFLIAGSFRPGQLFFRPYGGFYRRMLRVFDHLLAQTEEDRKLLTGIGIDRVTVTGDPRIDRTRALAEQPFADQRLADFTAGHPTLLAGSVWPQDVEVIAGAWSAQPAAEWRLVLAPHQLDEQQLIAWQQQFDAERYTTTPQGKGVMLLDTIGILSRAYRYGTVAFIGGGYGSGLHNTLEPMSYGLPVLFGTRYAKFPEARAAVARGGAFPVASSAELIERLTALRQPANYRRAQQAQADYLSANAGAARRTADLLLRLLLLLFFALPVSAQSWSTADRLNETLEGLYAKCNLMVAVSGTDWRPGLCLAATQLERSKTVSLEVQLRVARKYIFIASAAPGTTDLDLLVRDASGAIVGADTESDQTPIVELTVDTEATFTIQLHYVSGDSATALVALGMLRSFGVPLPDAAFREVSQQFGAAAGAVRAAGGARTFRGGPDSWCVFGYLLEEEEGATIENLRLGAGRYFFAATGPESVQDIDLYLAGDSPEILRVDREGDAYPMLDYEVTEPGPYRLRLEVERARGASLVLLGLFTN
ncbi:3-deoxy-D-manno-octulosonic acid transferase [Neolewinella sp.]|uniref:3-deoxy-D-manno-octulosonic acid transferase n=1 Tax=Neolewinella sp. TaxID=2993543 RepID=UPI003B5195E3